MFKTKQEVEVFVNYLELFIRRTVSHQTNSCLETATDLNRARESFQTILEDICSIGEPQQDPAEDYKCPDCGSAMKERRNRQNGNKFYGCTKYPECRGTRDENGLSRQEREERTHNNSVTHQEGFSFNRKRNTVTEVGPQWQKGESSSG